MWCVRLHPAEKSHICTYSEYRWEIKLVQPVRKRELQEIHQDFLIQLWLSWSSYALNGYFIQYLTPFIVSLPLQKILWWKIKMPLTILNIGKRESSALYPRANNYLEKLTFWAGQNAKTTWFWQHWMSIGISIKACAVKVNDGIIQVQWSYLEKWPINHTYPFILVAGVFSCLLRKALKPGLTSISLSKVSKIVGYLEI